jgi:hypothetical protein
LGWCMFAKFSSTEIFSNLYFSFSQLMWTERRLRQKRRQRNKREYSSGN